MSVSELQAIVFDFDGVLVESVELKTKAFSDLYAKYGPEVVSRVHAHQLANCGAPRYEKFRYIETVILGKPDPSADEMAALDAAFSDLVEKQVINALAVPGADELLLNLHPRLSLYVVSATPQKEISRIVANRGWSGYFDSVHGSPRSKVDNLRHIIEFKGYASRKVLMIGDALADFEASRICGIRFLGRVPPNSVNPFPVGVKTVLDLNQAAVALGYAND